MKCIFDLNTFKEKIRIESMYLCASKEEAESKVIEYDLFEGLFYFLAADIKEISYEIADLLLSLTKESGNLKKLTFKDSLYIANKIKPLYISHNILLDMVHVFNEWHGFSNNDVVSAKDYNLSIEHNYCINDCDLNIDWNYKNDVAGIVYKMLNEFLLIQGYIKKSFINEDLRKSNVFYAFAQEYLGTTVYRKQHMQSQADEEKYWKSDWDDNNPCVVNINHPGREDDIIDQFIGSLKSNSNIFHLEHISGLEYYIYAYDIILRNGWHIKLCQNCNKYFIPYNRSDALYCDRISPQDNTRTCKEYGTERLWYERLKKNEAAKLYRNIYQAKQMLVKRNPDIPAYKEYFESYKDQAKQWKAEVKNGTKSEKEFLAWLRTVKEKKV